MTKGQLEQAEKVWNSYLEERLERGLEEQKSEGGGGMYISPTTHFSARSVDTTISSLKNQIMQHAVCSE